ncbi:MAG: glycosyltransferase [Janthinobacterium lividum]
MVRSGLLFCSNPRPCDIEPAMPTATVDVLIPVYNGASTIESALRSIQHQSLLDIRMILIDDGSTDESAQIIERMAEQDGRIVLLRQANSGIVDALNAGLALCTAPLIARHDADDLAAPDRFEKQIAYLEAHPDCSAVSGAVVQIDEAGKIISGVVHVPPPERADATRYPQIEPYLIHPFLMIRYAALRKMGGYRHVFHAEDTDLYWRLQEVGSLHNMRDVLGNYRIHDGSVSGSSLLNGRISAVNSQSRESRRSVAVPAGPTSIFPRTSWLNTNGPGPWKRSWKSERVALMPPRPSASPFRRRRSS